MNDMRLDIKNISDIRTTGNQLVTLNLAGECASFILLVEPETPMK